MKRISARKAVCAAVALALTGCSMTSPMLKPNVSAPAAWNEAAPAKASVVAADWWQSFGSTELHALVNDALAGSPDLAIAMERVQQAEAQVRISGASLFPTLDLGYGTSARQTGDSRGSTKTESSSATLSVSYELDLWGRNRSGVRSAESSLAATKFDRDTATQKLELNLSMRSRGN